MMTDPIADMLTRIRNAVRVERAIVEVPSSKVKRGVADVLKREGYIWDWKEVEGEPAAKLQLELKYGPNGERLIRHIRRVSSPGRRVYSRSVRLRPVLGGLGISILSTSSGVVSDREARQRKLAGEVLCGLWGDPVYRWWVGVVGVGEDAAVGRLSNERSRHVTDR